MGTQQIGKPFIHPPWKNKKWPQKRWRTISWFTSTARLFGIAWVWRVRVCSNVACFLVLWIFNSLMPFFSRMCLF